MTTDNSLAHLSYVELEALLRTRESSELLRLLDSRSVKVGDVAAEALAGRRAHELVGEELLAGRFHTKLGKVRALNVLCRFGVEAEGAWRAYEQALGDPSNDVLSCALFGLVFLRRKASLPVILEHSRVAPGGSERSALLTKAAEAIEADSPHLFEPGFWDRADVWKLGSHNER